MDQQVGSLNVSGMKPQTFTGIFDPIELSKVQSEPVIKRGGLFVMPGKSEEEMTDVEAILEEVRSHKSVIEGMVVVYRVGNDYFIVDDQGSTAEAHFFLEKAKMKLLQEGEEPQKKAS